MTQKKNPPDAVGAKVGYKTTCNGNSTEAQRKRLHDALRASQSGLTTLEIRHGLDILMPATRVYELRHWDGLNVVTHWSDEETQPGKTHRVARYVLMPGQWRHAA